MSADEPGLLVGARKECPLIVGRGDGEQFIGSAIPAFLRETRTVQYIGDDEIVVLRPEGVEFQTAEGEPLEREIVEIDWDADTAEKQGYETFMLKEIYEQADAVAETIGERAARDVGIDLGDLGAIDDELAARDQADRDRRLRHLLPRRADRPLRDRGVGARAGRGRHRLRVPLPQPGGRPRRPRDRDLAVGGDGRHAGGDAHGSRRAAPRVLAVTNIMGSQATREADGVLYTRAGLEIGVAATKTFVSQVAAMYLLALRLAELRGDAGARRADDARSSSCQAAAAPDRRAARARRRRAARRIAEETYGAEFFLYLGRHVGLPVALEGALKLKEISYIATDAYAAGEMKHGPIALLDESTPVVVVATDSPVLEKVISNIQEVRARGARVIGGRERGQRARSASTSTR